MNGLANLNGWQWLVSGRVAVLSRLPCAHHRIFSQFILEGIPAILCGVLVWFVLPDYPETAKFLSVEERAFAVARLGDGAPKGTDKHFDKTEAINCLKSWQFWVFAVHYFCM